jgi:hypothetical protein
MEKRLMVPEKAPEKHQDGAQDQEPEPDHEREAEPEEGAARV